MVERLAAYGARAAIASGILAVIALAFLLLFYALEAPALFASGATDVWVPLGRTNDALIGLTALAAVPLAARLHVSWRPSQPGVSMLAFAIGAVAFVLVGATQLLFAANLVSTAVQTLLLGPLLLGVAAWLLAVNVGRADGALRGGLLAAGLAAGIGYGLTALTTLLYASAGGGDPRALFSNPILVVFAGLGLPLSQLGYPVWAIWLARRMARQDAAAG